MIIIDAHTHFYNPSRPQSVPWPEKSDVQLYRPFLPKDYRARPVPQAVTGVVVIEASPWIEDNQWVLDLAAKDPFIVGFVGNLPTGTPDFGAHLRRFAANPLFRGVRIKHALLKAGLDQPAILSNLRLLNQLDLELDVYGGPSLLPDVAKLAELLPDLRIVVNHVANVKIDGQTADAKWCDGIRAAAVHQRVFCKVSALVEGAGHTIGTTPSEVTFYRSVLDVVFEAFGEDRVIYGSNWPVCERFAQLATVQGILMDYLMEKGKNVTEKFFYENAVTAYGLAWAADSFNLS